MATRKTSRQATKRKTYSDTEDSDTGNNNEKKIRNCARSRCPATMPICFARATASCCGNGYTSRWYHVTAGEHFCNECFEHYYRSYNAGYDTYASWKRLWSQYGVTENGIRCFVADQLLPFWVQCKLCKKWRSVFRETRVTPRFFKNYVCTKFLRNQSQESACESPEDFRIELAKEAYVWPYHIVMPQFIKHALYAPYVRDYFQDAVGISPSDTSVHKYEEGVVEVRPYQRPFQDVDDNMAMTLPPNEMSEDELLYFPEFNGAIFLKYYLIIRNTLLIIWNLSLQHCVTTERCMEYIIMRGLSRVWITIHVNRVLEYLTLKGYINYGVIKINKEMNVFPAIDDDQMKNPVIIIGAGLSGLSAARQLTNLGIKVIVLEADNHIGGRAVDEGRSKFPVQSHIVVGSYNNPLVIMSKQVDISIKELGDECVLISDNGDIVDDKLDKRMQFHFDAMLDSNKHLRKDLDKDISLEDRFTELHNQFKEESDIKFSKLEDSLLRFHRSNLEFACGSNLCNISALYWDQNDEYPQFHGPPVLINGDFTKVVNKLAEDIDIRTNMQVTDVDYSGDVINIKCKTGETLTASKVIVTVPLHVLNNGSIKFTPSLPETKKSTLGCGCVEKVLLEFPCNFWTTKIKTSTMFGQILSTSSSPGLFDVFYDISKDERHILSTYISGDAVNILKKHSDEQIIEMCLDVLKAVFTKQDIPEPTDYYISRWYNNEHVGMSYSYIPINCTETAFDNLEQDIDEKIFFAGEATHKQYHQTLAGAYISGLREAEKIYRLFSNVT
ncbi:Lysine-specific histone demethylase 1B [Mactra antiquata]